MGLPRCGQYLVRYSHTQVVVLEKDAEQRPCPRGGVPPDPDRVLSLSEFDQSFLDHHAMAWPQEHAAA
jgi:hypothetical protein